MKQRRKRSRILGEKSVPDGQGFVNHQDVCINVRDDGKASLTNIPLGKVLTSCSINSPISAKATINVKLINRVLFQASTVAFI